MADPIKKITLADGTTRYRFVIDIGAEPRRDPATGEVLMKDGKPVMKRRQLTVTKDTKKEAAAEHARIKHQVDTGEHVMPSKMTVADLVAMWLKDAIRDVERSTARSYEDAMRYVVTHLGEKQLQRLTKEDVASLVDWMLTSARRIGGKPGTGLSVRTVNLTLGRLRAALSMAMDEKFVTRNVAANAKVPRQARKDDKARRKARVPWTEEEVKEFLAHCSTDRLYAVMLLSLIGLRPAEVCGLRWQDVDLAAGTLSVETTRTLVEGVVIEKDAKSAAGERKLPLPLPVLTALKAFHKRQAKERLAAGEAYKASGRVVVDELGAAVKTDWLRRRAYERMQSADVRRVRLYDARHACLSWMANNGVPDTVVSAWAGHSDLGFTKRVYVHPDPQSLKAGSDRLADLLG